MKRKKKQIEEEPREDEALEGDLATEAADGTEEPAEPEDEFDRLTRENAELKLQWARAQADYQNQKRRAQADYEAGVRRTLQPLLVDLLQVLDYLDMALASPATTDEAKNLSIGVEMTRQQFLQALSAQNVKAIETEGAFDPKRHEATKAEVREDVAPGSILSVVRKGYRWGDEVLRFAHVVVAKSANDEGTGIGDGDGPEVVSED